MSSISRGVRLSRTKTLAELVEMNKELLSNKNGSDGYIYDKKTIKKMDDIAWAIYYLTKRK